MNALAVHRRHMQAVTQAKFLGVFRPLFRELLDDMGRLGDRFAGYGRGFLKECFTIPGSKRPGRQQLHKQSQHKEHT